MSFRRRTFTEVLDNMVTAISGGVAAESHPFPPPGANGTDYPQPLQHTPVADVVSVFGTRDGQLCAFRKDVDYTLSSKQALVWKPGARLPDAGTLIDVNYLPQSAAAVLTDFHTGSVIRTVCESVALEVARLYAQLEAVYQSGFVDTATGSALENTVALLGIERITGGRPAGEVELVRTPGTRGIITIPAGTRIITADGNVEYATTETAVMADGQNALRVNVRDSEANDPLPADSLTVLPIPIAGISSVTNPRPTAIATTDETDVELRTRAKSFLHGSERATVGALKAAIARQGIAADVDETFDASASRASDAPGSEGDASVEIDEGPGKVRIVPHADQLTPELEQRLLTAIDEVRPIGVEVILGSAIAPARVDLELRITTADGLLETDLRAAQRSCQDKLAGYFKKLPIRENGSINQVVGLVLGISAITDITVVSAKWTADGATSDVLDRQAGLLLIGGQPTVLGELKIVDTALPTNLDAILTYTGTLIPDATAVRASLTTLLSATNSQNAAANASASLGFDSLRASALQSVSTNAAYNASAYSAQFVLVQGNGLSRILAASGDPAYALTPFERLSLRDVQVKVGA